MYASMQHFVGEDRNLYTLRTEAIQTTDLTYNGILIGRMQYSASRSSAATGITAELFYILQPVAGFRAEQVGEYKVSETRPNGIQAPHIHGY